MTAAEWVVDELRLANLGDRRRVARLAQVVTDLAAHPGASLPAACGSWAATKAAYRFFDEAQIEADAILDAHISATVERLAGERRILVLQDTTELDFSAHPAVVGTGPLAHSAHRGLLVHSALAATLDGVPLGLLHQHRWTRDPQTVGQRHTRRQRPTSAKESQRWLDAQTAIQTAVPADVATITVADREADLYDLFALPRPPRTELLIRACRNRRVDHEARLLWPALATAPIAGLLPIAVPRRDDRPAREAVLAIRYVALRLQPPRHHRQRASLAPIPVVAILAEELDPPADEPAICWRLLTTRRVMDLAEAVECVRWYAARWLIERFHYALKEGCRVEALQLRTVERLERALATFCLVAWRWLWLTYLARADADQPCAVALSEAEWQALWAATQPTSPPPTDPPPLGEAVRAIARLGGFLGRAGDGAPGVKVVWRGLRRLQDITLGWQLAHRSPLPPLSPPVVGNA